MNSWLPSMRWPDFRATERAMDTASTNPSMAMASAPEPSALSDLSEKSGSDSGGNCCGSSPTRWMPWRSSPSGSAARLPRTMANNIPGQRGRNIMSRMPTASVTAATSVT